MKKHKVLFLIESLSGGGAEKALVTLLQYLDKSRFDITLCCVSNTGKYLGNVPDTIHYSYILPSAVGFSAWASFWYKIRYKLVCELLPPRLVYRLFIPKGNDTEVAFTEGFVTKLLAASSNRGAKKITWVHTDLAQNPWTQSRKVYRNLGEERNAYATFNSIVCVSKSVAETFRSIYRPQSPVTVLYNPVDRDEIRRLAKECSPVKWQSTDDSIIRLVSVGRLAAQKGYDRLMRICGRLRQEGYLFELYILGEGGDRKELEQFILQEGLDDCVQLHGFLSNPYPLVADADLFVCPSRAEGFSTAVTESLILGVPVLATNCAGMRELAGNFSGVLITDNDEQAFYLGLKSLLDNRAMLAQMRDSARLRGDEFSLETPMQAIGDLLL